MRYYCDIEGLAGNWIDVSDKWTRGEVRRVEQAQWADDAEFFAFLAGKVPALHIVNEAGQEATTVADLTDEFLDECDARLAGFVASTPLWAVRELMRLGNWSARRLSDTAATKAA